jgi:hypothetical protein
MKQGMLAKFFKGVAAKRLTAVETDPKRSNQHEFNGRGVFRTLLGTERRSFEARFIYLADEQEGFSEDGKVKWYDARENVPTRAAEYRLYYPTTAVSKAAKEGDALFVALRTNDSIMFIVTPAGSTVESQLLWLFGLPDQKELNFFAHRISKNENDRLDFAVRFIFDELGIESEEAESDFLDEALLKFGKKFPSMVVFSALARSTLPEITGMDDADAALIAWLEREELLFRRLERRILSDRIKRGFIAEGGADVDGFIALSLSVQNRRKMRAGSALENHLEFIFRQRKISVGKGCQTELKKKPDFLFPGCAQYADSGFPSSHLTMLGAKSTLKDRWRQVVTEADRIAKKHLITLSPGLSVNQTEQMKSQGLQLVIPKSLQATFLPSQRSELLTLQQFIELVASREEEAISILGGD